MLKEFKDFAIRGNVTDMAAGINIGAAFGRIITSFVKDTLMPPIGLIMGDSDSTNLFNNLGDGVYESLAAAQDAAAATVHYGLWLNTVYRFRHCRTRYFLGHPADG